MKNVRYFSVAGKYAALLAAYALVFNMALTSTLLASISPTDFAAQQQICLNSASREAAADKNAPVKPMVRCPVCLSGAVAIADVPPPSPVLAIRVALRLPFEITDREIFVARTSGGEQQPRGPPSQS